MKRLFAVAVLCGLVTNVGCTQLRQSQSNCGCLPNSIATSQNAPRPTIMRTAYHQPAVGMMDMAAADGYGRGNGFMGTDGQAMVTGCVDCVLDCNGYGCGDACGGPGGCGPGGCQQGCSCGGRGLCAGCKAHRLRCMAGHLAHGAVDGGACMTDAAYNFNQGPPSGQVAYPYYTTRGPRDFFCNEPASIGPY